MALPRTCNGLRPRLPEHEAVPARQHFLKSRRLGATAIACVIVLHALLARAQAPDLLDNERAFAFAARVLDAQSIEARFVVAPGYYLYRDKLRFAVEGAAVGESPNFPPGEMKHDEFFGNSQTYRGTVVVRLPLARATPGRSVTVLAESQGCADLGVCYPPQKQKVTVAMPPPGGRPGSYVEAAPEKKRWFGR